MTEILSIKELAAKYKLIYLGSCNCDGSYIEKYGDGINTLQWRKYKYQFRFRRYRKVVQNWTSVNELQNYLKNYYEPVQAEV